MYKCHHGDTLLIRFSQHPYLCFIRSSLALNVLPPPNLLQCSRYSVSAKFVMLLHQLIYDCILQPASVTFGLLVCLPDLSQSRHTLPIYSPLPARPSATPGLKPSTPAAIRSRCQPGLNSCLWVSKMSQTFTEWGGMGVKEVKGANKPVELQHVDLWFARFGYAKINFTVILKTAATNICQQMLMFVCRRLLIHERFFYQSLNCSWESPLFMFGFERRWLKWVCWSCSLHISFAAGMRFACDFDDPPSFHFISFHWNIQIQSTDNFSNSLNDLLPRGGALFILCISLGFMKAMKLSDYTYAHPDHAFPLPLFRFMVLILSEILLTLKFPLSVIISEAGRTYTGLERSDLYQGTNP